MPTLPNSTRNSLADHFDSLVNTGTGTAQMRIYTASFATLLVAFDLPNPAFGAAGAVVQGRIDLQGVPIAAVGVGAGSAAVARLVDRNSATVAEYTAGTSGTEVILDNVNIAVGQNVSLLSATMLMPAT